MLERGMKEKGPTLFNRGYLTARFIRERVFSSWGIRYLTRGTYSHVDLFVNDPRGCYLGARFSGGVQLRSADYISESAALFLRAKVPDVNAALIWAYDQVGKPYDWQALIGDVIEQDWHEQSRWFCSEFVAAAFRHGGLDLIRRESVNRIMPADLLLSPFWEPITVPHGLDD